VEVCLNRKPSEIITNIFLNKTCGARIGICELKFSINHLKYSVYFQPQKLKSAAHDSHHKISHFLKIEGLLLGG